MLKQANLFSEVASRVISPAFFNQILEIQQNTFDIQPYKIESIQGQSMMKIYLNINNRYGQSIQGQIDPNNWNQNERRVFVWFIVCYTHFLQQEHKQITQETWKQLSPVFFGKKPQFLQFQYLNLLKNKQRTAWTPEEDQLLIQCTNALKPGKWNEISKNIFYESAGKIFRTPKHCRQRWLNHLDQNIKHGNWSTKEDTIIFEYVLSHGKRWSKIVHLLSQSRTEHMIKNRYNSLIAKSKGGKKQKEEEVAKKILIQLNSLSSVEQEPEKPCQLKGETRLLEPKTEIETDLSLPNSNQMIQIATIGDSIPSTTFTQPIQFGCYFNCNYYYPANDFFFGANTIGLFSIEKGQNPFLQFSKGSSFSAYKPQPQA